MAQEQADKPSVLLILGDNQLRGSYARSLSLIERLSFQGIRTRVLTGSPLPSCCRVPAGTRVLPSRYLGTTGLREFALRQIAAELAVDPPNLIDIQQRRMLPVGVWLSRRLRIPFILTVHDYLSARERVILDPTLCRRVVAVSESVRSEFLDRVGLSESAITIIPTGVAVPADAELSEILGENRVPVVGTAGPLEVGKGIQHFLNAAVLIRERHPQTLFLVAGSGPEEKPLRRLARQLKLVDCLTILPNLPEFTTAMKAMDIFVLPSLKQGLGATMLDAMVRGLPVIGTESGGVYSVVTHQESGLLVPPSDETRLAESVCSLLNDPPLARRLGQNARRRVIESFQVDSMIEATCAMYRQVLTEPNPSRGPAATGTMAPTKP